MAQPGETCAGRRVDPSSYQLPLCSEVATECVDNRENILQFGACSLGKCRLASAIVDGVVSQCYRVHSAGELLQELRKARSLLRLNEVLLKLDRYRVIDDLGYVKRDNAETGVLFELIAHRYERGNLIITSPLQYLGQHLR